MALLASVAAAYGPEPKCGPMEAEGWVTEPWTFGKKESLSQQLGCIHS